MAHVGKLPQTQRIITTHNAEGKAVISDSVDSTLEYKAVHDGVGFGLAYTSSTIPVEMNDDKDIAEYKQRLETPPGLVERSGSILRFVDVPPGSLSPMHRTVSLDYGVVLFGTVELVLDSGETRLMNPGDVCIQRATNHAWRNTSETEWARMMFVLQPSEPVKVNGKELREDLANMKGVRTST